MARLKIRRLLVPVFLALFSFQAAFFGFNLEVRPDKCILHPATVVTSEDWENGEDCQSFESPENVSEISLSALDHFALSSGYSIPSVKVDYEGIHISFVILIGNAARPIWHPKARPPPAFSRHLCNLSSIVLLV